MRSKSTFAVSHFVVPGLVLLTTAIATPVFAQYGRVDGPAYYGPAYGAPAYTYREQVFRRAYNQGPAIAPFFYGDGWVAEPIYDHSRTGGIDPNIRPFN
ncbi:MAG TPA: hypothetical protein VKT76_17930 [Bradyrhizobium sp.]|nr:hypothetical protein [Bradyrhizobium sp.]